MSVSFDKVDERLQEAKAITWDTCHKIYVLMDDEQVEEMRTYGYDPIVTANEATPDQMLELLHKWFNESCALRFIDAVSTNHENPNAGFETLIGQFAVEEEEVEEEDEEYCVDCGEHEAYHNNGRCLYCEEAANEE